MKTWQLMESVMWPIISDQHTDVSNEMLMKRHQERMSDRGTQGECFQYLILCNGETIHNFSAHTHTH